MAENPDRKQVDEWLALLGGPGFRGMEAREQAVAEMRAVGADRLFPLLVLNTRDPDPENRCAACEAATLVDAGRAPDLLLPLLSDSDEVVRCEACGCLSVSRDERAVAPLIKLLQSDPDAMVRGYAAFALGKIGCPAAIPALLAAMDSDHEFDVLGHSPSSCAATGLDDILGTDETRIKVSETLCRMQEGEPDLDRLRNLARNLYQQWSAGQI